MRWDKHVANAFVKSGLLTAVERWEARQTNVLRVLAYHRIGYSDADPHAADPSLFSATPEQFAEQMRFLDEQYCVLSIDAVLSALNNEQTLPPRSVLVTFDDAYQDFGRYAWPVLRGLRMPAVLFVPTEYVSGQRRQFWWDELYCAIAQAECQTVSLAGAGNWSLRTKRDRQQAFGELKRLVQNSNHRAATALVEGLMEQLGVPSDRGRACLTWQDIREMVADGLAVGAHTRSHPLLSRISLEEAQREIAGSQQDILRQVGKTWPIFAYPSGHPADLQTGLLHILMQDGFQMAVTMFEGHNVLGRTPPLLMKRVGMAPHLSLDEFRLALTGVYSVYGSVGRLRTAVSIGSNRKRILRDASH